MVDPFPPGPPGPITAVLFDFSSTLVDIGEPEPWLEAAWRRSGRDGTSRSGLGQDGEGRLVRGLRHFWDDIKTVDQDGERDLSPVRHQEIFGFLLERLPDVDPALGQALMVGDDALLDSGAALLGIRTLLLPFTHGRSHGLGIVLKILD